MSSISSPLSQRLLDIAMMATTASFQSSQPTANHRILSILQGSTKITQEIREILESASKAFHEKCYKTATRYYSAALDSWNAKNEKRQNQLIILTKYMLCMCWLESPDAKDLLDSLKTLKELETNHGYEYPMLYYAIGKAYFKLYRFNEADSILKKGFSVLNGNIHVSEFNIPGTNIVIPESSKERLVAALVTLNEQCSSWHRPDAVCCMPNCSSHSHNEGLYKHIFFRSPTFNGIVQVSCSNPNVCIMNFHSACWKAKKEELCSLGISGKMSDKDVLNYECFTPNCEHQGIRCTIKKIEIYDENAELKAVIEPRSDDVMWHAKPNQPPKGAIRKQQQQQTPKVKVQSVECRPAAHERPVRPQPVPNNVSAHNNTFMHRAKIEETEDEEDVQDELDLKTSIEKLRELRANNFGIKNDEIWRPDSQMYGNEYMLSTAELIPDPDFGDSGIEEADLKAFFFSYFFEFISANGPVKLDDLNKKWIEAKDIHVNSDTVLKHYLDISEFLVQSVKFAIIGDYICVAGKLPEAYELAKNDTCEILRFFMENDIDQLSNSSSVDDEAAYEAIINPEKNNNSLPYSSAPTEDKIIVEKTSVFSNELPKINKKNNKQRSDGSKATQAAGPSLPSASKTEKAPLSKSTTDNQENKKITAPEIVGTTETKEEKKPTPPSQISAKGNVTVATSIRKTEKQPFTPDCPAAAVADKKSEPIVKKATENRDESSAKAINGIHEPKEKEEYVLPPLNSSISFDKLTEPIEDKLNFVKESKSTNDLQTPVTSLVDSHNVLMNNSDEPNNGFLEKRFSLTPQRRIEANPSKSELEKISDTYEVFNRVLLDSSTELLEYKKKALLLESELNNEKEKYAAMRVRMLQKSLQCQYAYNYSKIMMRIEECRRNSEIYADLQAMLKKSIGYNMPNYEGSCRNVIEKLKVVSNNHEEKFNELNEQLFLTKEPTMIEEINLQLEPLPDMPPFKLTDVIQAAFNVYRMHQTKKSQQQLPPLPGPAPAIRPPQCQPIINSQHWRPNTNVYAGPDLVVGNPGLVHQQNYMRNLSPIPQHMSQQIIRNVPPPPMNYPYFSHTGMQYPPVNPAMPQMQPISSAHVQQPMFNGPQSATSNPQQRMPAYYHNSPSAHRLASPVPEIVDARPQSAPVPNFAGPENPKLNPLMNLMPPLERSQNFPNLTQQNGQLSEKNGDCLTASELLMATFEKETLSSVTPELSTVSSVSECSSAPELKNSTFNANVKNLEQSKTVNSQLAISVPEIPKIIKPEEQTASTEQQPAFGQENMENGGVWKICIEKLKQLDLNKKDESLVAPENNCIKQKEQNLNGNIVQAPPYFSDEPRINTAEDIDVHATDNTPDYTPSAKSETVIEVSKTLGEIATVVDPTDVTPNEPKEHKKSEHSLDKLMKRLRKQYTGILELDLLKSVEVVRKLHNNSLSGVPMSEIIREADKYIIRRQQRQLCGYGKRMPTPNFAAPNAADRSCRIGSTVEGERKRQTSVSSTSSASSLKKEPQNSSSSKKKWEPVVMLNDGWKKETPESDCTICLESMLEDTASYTLQCQHTFHKMCIKNWYQHNQSCPTCRVHSTIDDEYPPLPLG